MAVDNVKNQVSKGKRLENNVSCETVSKGEAMNKYYASYKFPLFGAVLRYGEPHEIPFEFCIE